MSTFDFSSGKCLEPDCDEPTENGLFCKKHSVRVKIVISDRIKQLPYVSDMKPGDKGYVSSAFCFYLVNGQIFIGGSFKSSSKKSVVADILITMTEDGTVEITTEDFKYVFLWVASFALPDFVKVTVK